MEPRGEWETLGAYSARLEEPFRTSEVRQALAALVAGGESAWVRCGRLFKFHAAAPAGGRGCDFLVQPFSVSGRRALWAPLGVATGRPAALRAVEAASRLLGRAVQTPRPVACLVRPVGPGRWESLAVFQAQTGLEPLHVWLDRLLTQQNDYGVVREWARAVGAAIQDLHKAGVFHGGLDTWSIWVEPRKAPQDGIRFVELERSRIGAAPGPLRRLRDWATLDLPRRLLLEALGAGLGVEADPHVLRYVGGLRGWMRVVQRVRAVRRPPALDTTAAFLWDSSRDAAVDLVRERTQPAVRSFGWSPIGSLLQAGGRLFAAPEPLSHRLAVGVRAVSETLVQEIAALGEQDVRDVWVRLCCHDSEARRAYALATIQNLAKAGFSVSVLLVQDRQAVLDPERWMRFVSQALEPVGWQVRRAVYGYAPDESAWGVRSTAEYRRFLHSLAELRSAFPGISFGGPACAAANRLFLGRTAEAVRRAGGWEYWACRVSGDGLESGLVTDAVWLGQLGRFCRTAHAMAEAPGRPILVVEAGGGGLASRSMDAEEADAALARQFRRKVLAIASGLVEQVVLAQPATAGEASQTLAQQRVLRLFLRRLGGGRFVSRVAVEGGDSVWLLRFEDADGAAVWIGWSDGGPRIVTAVVGAERAYDLLGRNAPLLPAPRVRLTDMPVYFDTVAQ